MGVNVNAEVIMLHSEHDSRPNMTTAAAVGMNNGKKYNPLPRFYSENVVWNVVWLDDDDHVVVAVN